MDFSAETSKRLQNGAQLISFRAPQLNTIAFSVVLPFVPEATPTSSSICSSSGRASAARPKSTPK